VGERRRTKPHHHAYDSPVARIAVVLFAVALVAAACGSGQPTSTLQAVKAAFASQGIQLRQSFDGYGDSVVLFDKNSSAPIGYQHIVDG
jgi:hypothetical protein